MRLKTLLLAVLTACSGLTPVPDAGPAPNACLTRIDGPTQLDVDVRVGTVSGTLTLNGGAFPDSPMPAQADAPNTRGWLVLTGAYGDLYELPIGRSGAASFSALVFGGTYQVDLRTANDIELSGLPRGVITHLLDAITVSADVTLNPDVPLVTVSGTCTRNGATWADDAQSRGTVTFSDSRNGSRYAFDLGMAGPARYSGQVFSGAFDVTYVAGASSGALPSYAHVSLERGRTVGAAGVRDYDVGTFAMSGTVTLGGAALPDSPLLPMGESRGSVTFTDLATQELFVFDVGATGPGAWTGILAKGAYAVDFAAISDAALVGLPSKHTQRLAAVLNVSAPAQLDFDLTVTQISGTVTLAGQPLPDGMLPPDGSRGGVVFLERLSGEQSYFPIGATGAATYGGALFAGIYDVAFVTAPEGAVGVPAARPALLELSAGVSGTARAKDYDLHVSALDVVVDFDGGGAIEDGGVTLIDLSTGLVLDLTHDADAGTFHGDVFSGTYDLRLALGVRGRGMLAQQQTLAAGPVSLRFDVPLYDVSGTLTLNGAQMPDGPRGSLTLQERLTRWPVPMGFDQTGPGTFHGTVMGGLYDLRLLTDPNSPQVGMPATVLGRIATGCTR